MRVRRSGAPILRAACSALAALAPLACAKIEPPPGGPPDARPPGLMATIPDSLAVYPDFSGDVEFLFNETVSEGGSPNMGLGTGDLERLVILSPSDKVPKVRWKRSRVVVRPAEGWQPDRVYRVQLLPGVMDIRRNRSDSSTVVTFTTGAPLPTHQLTGRVWDWTTGRPAPLALVEALLLPDSLRYRLLADSTGRFVLTPIPAGAYVVFGVLDQNRNLRFDPREAWDSVPVPADSTGAGELWVFPHDSVGPRLSRAAVTDSLTATLTFTQPLDPTQRFSVDAVRVLRLPDSTRVAVLSLLSKPLHDSAYPAPAPPVDTTKPAGPKPGLALRPTADTVKPTRQPLETALLLRVGAAWAPGTTYLVEVDSVRNANRAAANVRGPLEVPKAKADSATGAAKDSAATPAPQRPPPRPPNQ